MEYLIITFRVITIMILALIIMLITSRRKISELPVFDFLVIITLGSVIGADIADPDIPHLPTAFAIVLLVGIQYLYSILILKSRRFGRLVTFGPMIIIENGQFIKGNLLKLKLSLDNILMMLREKNVFDINEVEFGIIESTGNLSILKKSQYHPVTPSDLKISTEYKGLSIPLIVEGKVYHQNMVTLNVKKSWLYEKLKENNIKEIEDVFFASINTKNELFVSLGLENNENKHNLRH